MNHQVIVLKAGRRTAAGFFGCQFIIGDQWIVVRGIETEAKRHAMFLVHNVLQEEDGGWVIVLLIVVCGRL